MTDEKRSTADDREYNRIRFLFLRVLGVDIEDEEAVDAFRERLAFLEMREKKVAKTREKRSMLMVALVSALLAAIVPGVIQWVVLHFPIISFPRVGN